MFQYATSYKCLNTKIYENTDLITWEEALELWNKYKLQVIRELEDDYSNPEMVIWTGCKDNSSYSNDAFHIDNATQVKDGEFVEVVTNVIDPNKVVMGIPVSREDQAIELLGDKWEDFKQYVDGIDDWDMSDVERYMNR